MQPLAANTVIKQYRILAPIGNLQMKHNFMLTITSLLSILFMAFHLADDIVRGWSREEGCIP